MAAFSEASFFSFLWVPQSASNTALQEVSQQQYVVHQTFLPLIFSTIVFNGNTFASFICPSNYLISVQTLKKKKKKKGCAVTQFTAVQQYSIASYLHSHCPPTCHFSAILFNQPHVQVAHPKDQETC